MKFYVELHCEATTAWNGCHSRTGQEVPSGIYSDMRIGRADLEDQAKLLGWEHQLVWGTRTHRGSGKTYREQKRIWLCPHCRDKE